MGGGSDLRSFYKDCPGAVISVSIDKYIYLSMHKYFNKGELLLKYSKTETIKRVKDIEHPIIRAVFEKYEIDNVDFNSTADIPSGTGMGSSSAFTGGLVNLCHYYKTGLILPSYEIARIACEIEIDILKEPIGKQDQYGCCLGGLKYLQFNSDESVESRPIFMSDDKLKELESNLLLFYTGTTRSASKILSKQNFNTLNSQKVKNNLKEMSALANELYVDLAKGNIDTLGECLDISWIKKRELAQGITNSSLDEMYSIAKQNGAKGGKLLGAGGGGFMLLYVAAKNQESVRRGLSMFRELPFKFDHQGTQIIYG